MNIGNIRFDSRNPLYKSPKGAIKAHTELTLRIQVADTLQPVSVKAVVKYDRHEEPAYYTMQFEETALKDEGFQTYAVSFPIHDTGLYWYHFLINTPDGTLRVGKSQDGNQPAVAEDSDNWQQTVYQRRYPVPEWIYGGVFYHIFVDRFHASGRPRTQLKGKINRHDWGGMPMWEPENGHIYNRDFFGGDLEGIRQKLPYLARLGVTCLYLSPIFEAFSNHKYDTANYERIDPMFGDEEDFQKLCAEASAHGIRILCDGVFAHTGSDSRYFDRYNHYGENGAYSGPDSPYRDWYCFQEDGSYDCWWDIETLPKLNKNNPDVINYITGENGIVRKWLAAGASGWRLDVADELPVSFMDQLVAGAKAEKPDALIIGEVWEDASNKMAYDERKNYFEGGRLDSVMNYPLRTAIIEFVRHKNAKALAETIESLAENYPPEVLSCLMNILGTHDSVRIITALAGKDLGADPPRPLQAETHLSDEEWTHGISLLKGASLLQMTLPGVPCIYYGDEAGTEGYKDPFNRTCYPWGKENRELLDWYHKIINIRRSRAVFRQGEYATIAAEDGFFAFARYDSESSNAGSRDSGSDSGSSNPDNNPSNKKPPVIVAVNYSTSPKRLVLHSTWQDLLTDQAYEGNATLPSGKFVLLERCSSEIAD